MRLFTQDSDDKPDTPLSFWIGLLFIGLAFGMDAAKIGPGGLGLSWDLGLPGFFLITGLIALVPGLFLTVFSRPE